jgi:hypothetical protein
LPLERLSRLTGAGDADDRGEPARCELDSPLAQLEAFAGSQVNPADVAAADLDMVALEVCDEGFRGGFYGFFANHHRLRL